jgi:hypothetical protein
VIGGRRGPSGAALEPRPRPTPSSRRAQRRPGVGPVAPLVRESLRSSRSAVSPSTFGISPSSTMASKRPVSAARTASAPSRAVTTSWPSYSSVMTIRARMSASSSATSSRAICNPPTTFPSGTDELRVLPVLLDVSSAYILATEGRAVTVATAVLLSPVFGLPVTACTSHPTPPSQAWMTPTGAASVVQLGVFRNGCDGLLRAPSATRARDHRRRVDAPWGR